AYQRRGELIARVGYLRGELDGDHVAVLDDVVAALEAQGAALAGAGVAAVVDQLLPGNDFGADEALLDVGVDLAGGVPHRQALAEVPGLGGLGLAGGEEGDQVQQLEGAPDHGLKTGL